MNVSAIIAYENDDLDEHESIMLFGELIRTGVVWQLQGGYGRTAAALINGGFIAADGTVLATIERVGE